MEPIDLNRRLIMLTSMLSAFAPELAQASPIDANETFVLPREQITYEPWSAGPPHSGEMAALYGDVNKPGLYLVMMKWNPGWFSAPHTYATDRIQVVVSGTWWISTSDHRDPATTYPLPQGSFATDLAGKVHWDGSKDEDLILLVTGMGPMKTVTVPEKK